MRMFWKVSFVGVAILLTAACCCNKAPQEVIDANAALNAAKQTCTPTYAASDFEQASSTMTQANDLVANRKCRDAKKQAAVAMQQIKTANDDATAEQAQAKSAAEGAISAAASALASAQSSISETNSAASSANSSISALVNDPKGSCNKSELVSIGTEITVSSAASSNYSGAKTKLDEARSKMAASECNYYQVKKLAEEAESMANSAKNSADAERTRVQSESASKTTAIDQALAAKPCSYLVKKGDCLWRISAMDHIYGNPFMWPLIWDNNKGLIKDHPDLIYPDWTFQINRTFSAEDAKNAEHTARYHHWEPPAPPEPENMAPEATETPVPEPAPAPAPTEAPAAGE